MRLFVIGANGRTGREIVGLARMRGHEVTAFVRSPEKLGSIGNVRAVRGDPRDAASIAGALPGHDAVLSAIGPRPRDALLHASTLLADCARATVKAMTASGVGRLAIVSRPPRLTQARNASFVAVGDALPTGSRVMSFRSVAAFMLDAVEQQSHVAEVVGLARGLVVAS